MAKQCMASTPPGIAANAATYALRMAEGPGAAPLRKVGPKMRRRMLAFRGAFALDVASGTDLAQEGLQEASMGPTTAPRRPQETLREHWRTDE